MMKLAVILGLTCVAFVVRGMEKCPPEFAKKAEKLEEEHPDWIACEEKVYEHGGMGQSVYCLFPVCRDAFQHLYEIFPENCAVEEWSDTDEDGTPIHCTKEYHASLVKTLCHWDLK